jgi:hypothetical protein
LALLLFRNKHEVWNKQSFLDLNHLSSAQQKHSRTQTHVPYYIQLKFVVKQQRVDLLLDAELANQEFLFCGHDKPCTSLNKGNFMEILNLLENHDPLLENHLNSASVN